tara:strand:+ start:21694 stop:22479 length:786 start_codon:yes stop_codon:yes gene_type:complete
MKIVIVSGGFDPLHSGHIAYLRSAKNLGNKLVVALNSDEWLKLKKGKFFLPFKERKIIIENLKMVDEVIGFEDDELGSCINALKKTINTYPEDEIIFCNGGDRNQENIPEMSVEGVKFIFAVGGNDKMNSSSWILREFMNDSVERVWGRYYNLFHDKEMKLKELIVDSKQGMSFQRHFYRNEIWFVSSGSCKVNYSIEGGDNFKTIELSHHQVFHVPQEMWHQIVNHTDKPCHIIEIQYGSKTHEDDIERLRFYEGNKNND